MIKNISGWGGGGGKNGRGGGLIRNPNSWSTDGFQDESERVEHFEKEALIRFNPT